MATFKVARPFADYAVGDTATVDDNALDWFKDNGYAGPEPEGSQYHDEIANTDPNHHGAAEKAPVHDGSPQGYGFTEAGAKKQTEPQPDDDPDKAERLAPVDLDAEQPKVEEATPDPYADGLLGTKVDKPKDEAKPAAKKAAARSKG